MSDTNNKAPATGATGADLQTINPLIDGDETRNNVCDALRFIAGAVPAMTHSGGYLDPGAANGCCLLLRACAAALENG